jgi:hypothetical protein
MSLMLSNMTMMLKMTTLIHRSGYKATKKKDLDYHGTRERKVIFFQAQMMQQ